MRRGLSTAEGPSSRSGHPEAVGVCLPPVRPGKTRTPVQCGLVARRSRPSTHPTGGGGMTIDACSTIPEDQAGTSNTRTDDKPEWDDGSSTAQYHVIWPDVEEMLQVVIWFSRLLCATAEHSLRTITPWIIEHFGPHGGLRTCKSPRRRSVWPRKRLEARRSFRPTGRHPSRTGRIWLFIARTSEWCC